MADKDISSHAKELSKRGASKGGRARVANFSKEELSAANRRAANARWQKVDQQGSAASTDEIRWAVAEGDLDFQDRIIPCAVLDNGARVLTQQGILTTLGRARAAKGGEGASQGGLPAILRPRNLAPFISEALREVSQPIIYRTLVSGRTRGIAYGCRAETLPMICQVYVDADDAGKLTARQSHIALAARKLLLALANVMMIALVDEATGWQVLRPHNELQRILEAYVMPEHRPWVKTVPVEFTKEIYRLWGWDFSETMQGPRYASILIRKYICEQLPPGVLGALEERNPINAKYQRKNKLHQFLSPELGLEHFKSQIVGTMALMRASTNKREFERLFQKSYGPVIQQGEFQFELDEPEST